MIAKLIPLLVAGGITAHSGDAIKERVQGLVAAKDTMITKQRMMAVYTRARLDIASGDELTFKNQRAFRAYVREAIRVRGNSKSDSSLDFWGKPFKGAFSRGKLVIISSGPDKKSGTKDDIKMSKNMYDY